MVLLWSCVGLRGSPGSGVVVCYLSLSSGDLTSTSSHMCGSWYLPIFLFRDGSLTLINMASLMAPGNTLALPAHYAEIVQRKFITTDVVMAMDG